MFNNTFSRFHVMIISFIVLIFILEGCGYKAPPKYIPQKSNA